MIILKSIFSCTRLIRFAWTLALLPMICVPCSADEYEPSFKSPGKFFRGNGGKHLREFGVGPVFLDFGFSTPGPYFQSRAGYAVVDAPGGVARRPGLIASNPRAVPFVARAEQEFRGRQYGQALRSIQHALIEDPRNGLIELFGAQASFAVGDYDGAADAIVRALGVLPQHQWNTVVANHQVWYGNGDYVVQMSRLEQYVRQRPSEEKAHLVRGYHFAFLGHHQAAMKDLEVVVSHPYQRAAASLMTIANGGRSGIVAPVPIPQEPTPLQQPTPADPPSGAPEIEMLPPLDT